MFKKSAAPAAGGYTIAKSVRLRSSASAYLSRTPGVAGNRKTWTFSAWIKRGAFVGGMYQGYVSTSSFTAFGWGGTGASTLFMQDFVNGSYNLVWETTALFRDPSAWYHVVFAYDSTQASSANALKLYVNGVQQTLGFSAYSGGYVQNRDTFINATNSQQIGTYSDNVFYDGYFAEINFIDGQQLTASSFGSNSGTGGVWQPLAYTGSYGTNGYYLKFTNTSSTATLGNDSSGNSNTFTVNNISLTAGTTYDSMTDVPTLTSSTVANYCVMNAISTGVDATITNGNLQIAYGTAVTRTGTAGTMGMSSGKWYWEVVVGTVSGSTSSSLLGITSKSSQNEIGNASSYNYTYYGGGTKIIAGVETSYGATYTTSDTIGIAFDADAGSLVFYKNNTSQGTAATGLTSGPYYPLVEDGSGGNSFTVFMNFGQQGFVYTPPTGYVALNTYNLSTPTIAAGNQYMDATLFTANGTNQTVTNAGSFKPDLVWQKNRSNAGNHWLTDSVRGVSLNLSSNNTTADTSLPNFVTSLNTNGYSIGTDNFSNGNTIVGWQWQSGQASISTNNSGNVTSNVCVSTTAGFSIISWAGSQANDYTIGHGLGVQPSFFIVKQRNAVDSWGVYYRNNGVNTNWMTLNSTNAQGAQSGSLSGGAFVILNSSTIQISAGSYANGGSSMIGYCWAEIAGFSKFGNYVGNGSADGPFIYTGFRPKFFMIKRTDATANWEIFDSRRDVYNQQTFYLFPNTNDVEYDGTSAYPLDFVSNGIKWRVGGTSSSNENANGGTYIYAAFAENPFKYALAR